MKRKNILINFLIAIIVLFSKILFCPKIAALLIKFFNFAPQNYKNKIGL
jgi:hypothetical protein